MSRTMQAAFVRKNGIRASRNGRLSGADLLVCLLLLDRANPHGRPGGPPHNGCAGALERGHGYSRTVESGVELGLQPLRARKTHSG